MRKALTALALLAAGPAFVVLGGAPAGATGLEIQVEGEGANGTIKIDLFEDVAHQSMWSRSPRWRLKASMTAWCFHRVIEGFMAQTGDVRVRPHRRQDMSYAGSRRL